MTGLAAVVAAYADPFNERYADRHGVTSPLGAWLLLALAAPVATGGTRTALEAVVGLSAGDAARQVARLLDDPHPSVSAAVAVWADQARLLPAFAAWRRPDAVESGPVPDQRAADAWAARHTDGLIERFPVPLTPDTLIVLASALATKVSWERPLEEAAGGLLRMRDRHGWQAVVDTDAAGPVAVAMPGSASGLEVMSVIAAPEVPPAAVHRAAHEIVLHRHELRLLEVSGDGHAWSVRDRVERRPAPADLVVEFVSTLPPWTAESDHDLTAAPGVQDVFTAMEQLFRPEDRPLVGVAKQRALASYSRTGFEAAAVTAMAMRAGSAPPQLREVTVREVQVRFDRPYAVLASVERWSEQEAWRGLPVFSAWVEPDETNRSS